MFNFFDLFRTKRTENADTAPMALMEPVRAKSRSDESLAAMIPVALSSVLRRRGIGSESIGCELVRLARPGSPDLMLTQLVIHRWHEEMIRLAPHLEKDLFNEIQLLDQNALPSDFLFVWKFALDAGYGQAAVKVPEPDFWASMPEMKSPTPPMAAPPGTAVPVKKVPPVKFDLPKSDRDELDDDGFPATQIGPP